MKDKRKKEIYSILLVLIIIGISLGYAALSATFNINGSSQVKNNTWDIHFANIVVNPNSVSIGTGDQAATITPTNTTEITYSVTLEVPGDFYEFTADVVNAGTIDGMVENIVSTVNGNPITDLPSYLQYSITYSSGSPIVNNHLLKSGTSVTYKVRLEYLTDIDPDDMPDTDQSYDISIGAGFIQKSSAAIELPYTGTIYWNTINSANPPTLTIGESIVSKANYYTKEKQNTTQYVKYTIVDDIATEVYICNDGSEYNSAFCVRGGIDPSDPLYSTVNNNNKNILRSAVGGCGTYNNTFECEIAADEYETLLNIYLYPSGGIELIDRHKGRIRMGKNGSALFDG